MKVFRACAWVVGMAVSLIGSVAVRAETSLERGRYLVTLMDCSGCHTTGSLMGRPDPARYLGGSEVGWFLPTLGVFYPSNLTPDGATGIGSWTKQDIVKLLRTGRNPRRPDGSPDHAVARVFQSQRRRSRRHCRLPAIGARRDERGPGPNGTGRCEDAVFHGGEAGPVKARAIRCATLRVRSEWRRPARHDGRSRSAGPYGRLHHRPRPRPRRGARPGRSRPGA